MFAASPSTGSVSFNKLLWCVQCCCLWKHASRRCCEKLFQWRTWERKRMFVQTSDPEHVKDKVLSVSIHLKSQQRIQWFSVVSLKITYTDDKDSLRNVSWSERTKKKPSSFLLLLWSSAWIVDGSVTATVLLCRVKRRVMHQNWQDVLDEPGAVTHVISHLWFISYGYTVPPKCIFSQECTYSHTHTHTFNSLYLWGVTFTCILFQALSQPNFNPNL